MIMNTGLTNVGVKKAVPCNLIEEILKFRDILVAKSKSNATDYEKWYEKHFCNFDYDDTYYEFDKECICQCIPYFLNCDDGSLKTDVQIYSCEKHINKEGKYQGLCKLPNGAEILVFEALGEEEPTRMCMVLYFDGEQLRFFTPYEGNAVNVVTQTCLLDETFCQVDFTQHPLYNSIYPKGLKRTFDDEKFVDNARKGYAKFLGIKYSDLCNGKFELDWDAICNEIETVLS